MSDSIWKKEISLGRGKKKVEPQAAAAPAPEQAPAPAQSLLKKELSFGRKPKQEKAPKPAAESSVWKKEISLGRKDKQAKKKAKADDAVARLVELATQSVAADFEQVAVAAPAVSPTELAEAVV